MNLRDRLISELDLRDDLTDDQIVEFIHSLREPMLQTKDTVRDIVDGLGPLPTAAWFAWRLVARPELKPAVMVQAFGQVATDDAWAHMQQHLMHLAACEQCCEDAITLTRAAHRFGRSELLSEEARAEGRRWDRWYEAFNKRVGE